ncbi:hypothetical protein JD969_00415 [Planctomycetota bacterium]|nr:hypothetical protein JD969_00415 [Planctomycetota bacterium]
MNKIKSLFLIVMVSLLCLGGQVFAQLDTVEILLEPSDLGIEGVVRRGTWTPLRVTLLSNGAEHRTVLCRWRYEDADGDTVVAQREVTLQPQVEQTIWLYGHPPLTQSGKKPFVVDVIDKESGKQLDREVQVPKEVVTPLTSVIGVLGRSGGMMGLERYRNQRGQTFIAPGQREPYITQHENFEIIASLQFDRLPDRWFGLSLFDTLIWLPQNGGSPNDARVNDAMLMGLREWVERGGHLVIMMPPAGQQWTSSPLGDMLPVTKTQLRALHEKPPTHLLGWPRAGRELIEIDMLALDVNPDDEQISVIAKDRKQNPLIATKMYGFGRVTVSGMDLSSPTLRMMNLQPPRYDSIWNKIIGWQTPLYDPNYIKEEIDAGRINGQRNTADLSRFIPSLITMKNTTGPALLLALLVFAVYWVIAGPVSFFALKAKRKHKFSWLVFTGVIGIFIAVAWGGAYMMRPTDAQVSHFSILDINTSTDEVHSHSWFSLYLPTFGDVKIELAPDQTIDINRNTISAPGVEVREIKSAFLDPQTYEVKASSPHVATVPFRSTTKTLEADYFGVLNEKQNGLEEPWMTPTANLKLDSEMYPYGTLKNNFTFPLRDVVFIYAKGDGEMPVVWRLDKSDKKWFAGETITISDPAALKMVIQARNDYKNRSFKLEGFLGKLFDGRRGDGGMFGGLPQQNTAQQRRFSADRMTQMIEMMSFYTMLPPPDFRSKGQNPVTIFQRPIGRKFDITDWLSQRRLIVIGYVDNESLPMPLTVDGEVIPSNGMTVVRWSHMLKKPEEAE